MPGIKIKRMIENQSKNYCLVVLMLITSFPALSFAQELQKTETSWNGAGFDYPKGSAQMTAVKLLLKEGEPTGYHCHPIPTFAYVLSGNLDVETVDGNSISFVPGDAFVEVMRTLHQGTAIGGDVEILVFYAGSTSIPNTVLATENGSSEHCIDYKNPL